MPVRQARSLGGRLLQRFTADRAVQITAEARQAIHGLLLFEQMLDPLRTGAAESQA